MFFLGSVFILDAQDNDRNTVGFGCYFQGAETPPVKRMRDLIEGHNFAGISKLLRRGKDCDKYLAVITLERLASLGQYTLTEDEETQISKIKASANLVSVCSGCTYFDKVALRTMFSEENFLGNQYWLDKVLEKTK